MITCSRDNKKRMIHKMCKQPPYEHTSLIVSLMVWTHNFSITMITDLHDDLSTGHTDSFQLGTKLGKNTNVIRKFFSVFGSKFFSVCLHFSHDQVTVYLQKIMTLLRPIQVLITNYLHSFRLLRSKYELVRNCISILRTG